MPFFSDLGNRSAQGAPSRYHWLSLQRIALVSSAAAADFLTQSRAVLVGAFFIFSRMAEL